MAKSLGGDTAGTADCFSKAAIVWRLDGIGQLVLVTPSAALVSSPRNHLEQRNNQQGI